MAIALNDNFITCTGFADQSTIWHNFTDNKMLHKIIPELTEGRFTDPQPDDPNFLEAIVTGLLVQLDNDKTRLESITRELEKDIS
jgi:hypothetical protein